MSAALRIIKLVFCLIQGLHHLTTGSLISQSFEIAPQIALWSWELSCGVINWVGSSTKRGILLGTSGCSVTAG